MEKKKRMTARERAISERVRKKLREEGLLPPKKKPLNRKAFVNKAKEVLADGRLSGYEICLYWALSEMLGKRDLSKGPNSISAEAVGAAKAILLAERHIEFAREKDGSGYTYRELIDAVVDIYEA